MPQVSEAEPHFTPAPCAQSPAMPGREIAKALRENALLAFPPEAFEEDVIVRSFLGRQSIILNRPGAIHHILIENPDNYRRTRATIRMLRPLLGKGLLLSEGEAWKHQRRTIAPAFAHHSWTSQDTRYAYYCPARSRTCDGATPTSKSC